MNFRNYQAKQLKEIIDHLSNPNSPVRAQVYAPTGSGKTVIFLEIIRQLHSILKGKKPLNIAIVHPRIALSTDQLKRFKDTFGTDFHATSFHSGSHYRSEGKTAEVSTLNIEQLERIIDNVGDHVTFTSYKSLHKIMDKEFDLLICDEAHNMVPGKNDEGNEVSKVSVLRNLKAKRILFFTATPINDEAEESEGMNNANMFGKIISETLAKPLIEQGYVVGPVIQTLDVQTDKRGRDGVDTTQIVAESFIKQKETMAKNGLDTVQMLVCSRGYDDHRKLENELQTLWKLIGNPVDLFVVEAKESRLNGRRLSDRYEALKMIAENGKVGKDTIVIHWDTLAEGIDISSLTGVVLLRQMKKSKILQTIGRAGRPYWKDLGADGEIKDMNKRMKPFSILTIPVVDGEHIGGQRTEDYAKAFIIGGYDELADLINRDGNTEPNSNSTVDEDDKEKIDPFYSAALSFKSRNKVEELLNLGLLFSF